MKDGGPFFFGEPGSYGNEHFSQARIGCHPGRSAQQADFRPDAGHCMKRNMRQGPGNRSGEPIVSAAQLKVPGSLS